MKKKLLGVFTSLCAVALITGCSDELPPTSVESIPSSLETSISTPQSEISSLVLISDQVSVPVSETSVGSSSTSIFDSVSTSVEPIQDSTISFVSNGGNDVQEIIAQPGVPITIPSCAKEDSTFIGWYVDNNFTTEFTLSIMPSEDTIVYARWLDVENALIVDEASDLQSTIDTASEYATVFVKSGIYEVSELLIEKPLTLLGNNYGLAGNSSDRLAETVFHPISNDLFNFYFQSVIINVTSPDVTIDGITVDGNNPEIANIWTTERHEELKQILSVHSTQGDTGTQLIKHLEELVGIDNDLCIDAGVGIYFGRPTATDAISGDQLYPSISNSKVLNSIIKNTSQFGVIVSNNRDTKATPELTATDIEISNNYIDNVWGMTSFDGTIEEPVYAGHYGRAIVLQLAAAGVVANNVIKNSTLGISLYYNYGVKEIPVQLINNQIIDTNTGIWVNSTQVGSQALITGNTLTFTQDLNETYYADSTHAAIAVTSMASVAAHPCELNIAENEFNNYKVGIRAMGISANADIRIAKNIFNNIEKSIYVADLFGPYSFANNSTQLHIFNDNTFNNSVDFVLDSLNAGAVVTMINDDNENQTINKIGTLATPKNFTLNQKNQRITWAAVSNAESYEVYVNNILMADGITTLYYNFADLPGDFSEDTFTIKVRAVENTYTELANSEFTVSINVIRFTKVERVYTTDVNDVTTTTSIYAVDGATLSKDNFAITKSNFAFDGWMNGASEVEIGTTIAEAGATYTTTWFRLYNVTFYGADNVSLGVVSARVGTVADLESFYNQLGLELDGVDYNWYTHKNRTATYLYETVYPSNGSGIQKAIAVYLAIN